MSWGELIALCGIAVLPAFAYLPPEGEALDVEAWIWILLGGLVILAGCYLAIEKLRFREDDSRGG
jgi:hypothetical protein